METWKIVASFFSIWLEEWLCRKAWNYMEVNQVTNINTLSNLSISFC